MAVTWMHCQERHYETGRQTHMCQDANSRLLSREVDGSARIRHGQELSTYSRFRRMQNASYRGRWASNKLNSKNQKAGPGRWTMKVEEGVWARGGFTLSWMRSNLQSTFPRSRRDPSNVFQWLYILIQFEKLVWIFLFLLLKRPSISKLCVEPHQICLHVYLGTRLKIQISRKRVAPLLQIRGFYTPLLTIIRDET